MVCCIIGCIVESFSIGGWIACIIAGLAGAVILFYTANFLSKLIWARIMLRVNISNNLKREEISWAQSVIEDYLRTDARMV